MENILKIKLRKSLKIELNGKEIYLPYKKLEAMIIYMIVKEETLRSKIVEILWGNIDEVTAKKNLRNAVYVLKKHLGIDLFISPKRSILKFNSEIKIETDLEECMISGEFLDGYYVKEAEGFMIWIDSYRKDIQKSHIEQIWFNVSKYEDEGQISNQINFLEELIQLDSYDEVAYRKLMQVYMDLGKHSKAVELFKNLECILLEDLSLYPDSESQNLYNRIIDIRLNNNDKQKLKIESFFWGREKELSDMKSIYKNMTKKTNSKALVLNGETGTGKTALMNKFILIYKENVFVINSSCYKFEEEFYLKPWLSVVIQIVFKLKSMDIPLSNIQRAILSKSFPGFMEESINIDIPTEKLEHLDFQTVEEVIFELLRKISRRIEIIIAFDDVHWMDNLSMKLLRNMIYKLKYEKILFVMTILNPHINQIDLFLTELGHSGFLNRIEIKSFDNEQSKLFIKEFLKDNKIDDNLINNIAKQSNGNALFLTEYLKTLNSGDLPTEITTRLRDILKNRYISLSYDARKILDLTSTFVDGIPFEDLIEISGMSDLEIMDILDELSNQLIFDETVEHDGRIVYKFTHGNFREYVYDCLSEAKKRIYHKRIATYYEKLITDTNGAKYHIRLIYNFKQSGDVKNELKYSLLNIYEYIKLNYEIFPVLNNIYVDDYDEGYIPDEQIYKEIENIEKLHETMINQDRYKGEDKLIEMMYLHVMARYYIVNSGLQIGVEMSRKLIDIANKYGEKDFALKGCFQLIYHGINTHDLTMMEKYIKQGLSIAKKMKSKENIGVLIRLKGHLYILSGNFKKGEILLNNAINILKSLDNPHLYVLNIAATYYYIGESKRFQKNFEEAIVSYEKAISICENEGFIGRLTLFYTAAGQASYEKGDIETAEMYLITALQLFRKLHYKWGRTTANGFMALILLKKGEHLHAFERLQMSEKCSRSLSTPHEKAVIYRIKAEMCNYIKNNNIDCEIKTYLDLENRSYCNEAIMSFAEIKTCYERDIVSKISELCNLCGKEIK